MTEPAPRRGRAHDAEGAREAILNAAEEVFAEHGFDGARIDAIAAAANYNKSLIFHYFGDKLGLYAALLKRVDAQLNELHEHPSLSSFKEDFVPDTQKFQAMLTMMIAGFFDYLVEHPHFLRILNWEMAEGWQTLTKVFSRRDLEDFDQSRPLLHKMQSAGLLRTGFDPTLQLIMAVYSCQYYLGAIPLFQILLPSEDFSSPAALARVREYIIDFVVHGLMIDHGMPQT